jgi:hypothetical protein
MKAKLIYWEKQKHFFFQKPNNQKPKKCHFPSISYYFHIPIIFDYLDFHCPTEVAVGTIIFPVRVEQFFFLYGLKFNYKSLIMLSSTKICSAAGGSNPGLLRDSPER